MNMIQMTISVTPEQSQYIAALVELWDLDGDLERGYAIRQLPNLVRDIALELEPAIDSVDAFNSIAETIEWDESDKKIIRQVFTIASNRLEVSEVA